MTAAGACRSRPADVDPRFLAMLKAYEDARFERHAGVDPVALARAGAQVLRHGRIVSGGSTLTMQVARLLEPRDERNLSAKIRQLVRAIQLERRFSKPEILGLYLTLAPYGGNLEGTRAAALSYFGREPKRLSLAEAALLVALPQSPELRRPDRFPGRGAQGARPGPRSRCARRRAHRCRGSGRESRACPDRAPALPDARRACIGRRGGGQARAECASSLHRRPPPSGFGNARARAYRPLRPARLGRGARHRQRDRGNPGACRQRRLSGARAAPVRST